VEDVNTHADKAFLLDPTLNESLIGKALYYMQTGQYELSIEFFNKVLAKSPNSTWVHNLLSTIYILHLPNAEQYLRHTIQGIRYSVAGQDSPTISMAYLHLSNSLAQNGFLDEAAFYLDKSLAHEPDNRYAALLSIYVQLGKDADLDAAYQRLEGLLAKDTSSLAVLQELGKIACYQGNHEAAWHHYQRFLELQQAAGLDIYPGADINIAYVLEQLGRSDEAQSYRKRYFDYLQGETSIYRELGEAVYHASIGEEAQAMTSLQAFAEQEGYQFWMVMFINRDPILRPLAANPAFEATIKRIKDKFWKQHREMRTVLEAEGVMGSVGG